MRAEPERPEGRLTEWLLRAFALLTFGFAVANLAGAWWADVSRWTLLVLLTSEGYTLGLLLVARRANSRDLAPLSVLATGYALFYYVLLTPDGTVKLIPEMAGVALQMLGFTWQFAAKVALGRSFGLLPAHRALVLGGPYRLVRHPIYLGYLVSHVGLLLVNASWRNLVVLVVLYAAQAYRIQREEAVLAMNSEYQNYQQRVRWRLFPGVY